MNARRGTSQRVATVTRPPRLYVRAAATPGVHLWGAGATRGRGRFPSSVMSLYRVRAVQIHHRGFRVFGAGQGLGFLFLAALFRERTRVGHTSERRAAAASLRQLSVPLHRRHRVSKRCSAPRPILQRSLSRSADRHWPSSARHLFVVRRLGGRRTKRQTHPSTYTGCARWPLRQA